MRKTHWVGTVPINLSNIKNSRFLGFLLSGVVSLPATSFEMTFKCIIPDHLATVTWIKSCSDFTAPHTSPSLPDSSEHWSCELFIFPSYSSCCWLPLFSSAACQCPGPPQHQTLGIVSAVLTCLQQQLTRLIFGHCLIIDMPLVTPSLAPCCLGISHLSSGRAFSGSSSFLKIFLFFKLQCVYVCMCVLKHVYPMVHMEVREQLTRVYSLLPPLGIGFLNWTQLIKPGGKCLHPLNHLTDPDLAFLFFFSLNVIINYSLVRIFLSYY